MTQTNSDEIDCSLQYSIASTNIYNLKQRLKTSNLASVNEVNFQMWQSDRSTLLAKYQSKVLQFPSKLSVSLFVFPFLNALI